jgi:phosphoglucosamine mutase
MAPAVFWELGAQVVKVGVDPDGFNINDGCGSTNPERMRELVVSHNAHLGLALDGDADRVLFCDERGDMIDGDQILGVIARQWQHEKSLQGGGVVATVMSNLGLERFLTGLGLTLKRTNVGDRYVVEEMKTGGYNLGGEQSGHIILGDHSTTGDGIIAALQVLAALVQSGKPASQTLRVFQTVPQKLKNVRLAAGQDATAILATNAVKSAIADVEKRLESKGRLLIRKSGTEPLIRVMAEADDAAEVDAVVALLVETITKAAA